MHLTFVLSILSILKKHIWNVHEDRKTHQCQIPACKNSFKTASGLEYHIKVVHHGGKENYCAICDKEFDDKKSLRHSGPEN